MGDVGDVLEPVKKGKVTAWDENHQYQKYHCLSYIVIAKNILKPHKQRWVPVCQWSSTLDCPSYKYSCPNIYHCAWSLPWSWGCTPRSVWSLLRGHLSQFSSGSNHPAPKSAAKMLQQEEIQYVETSRQNSLTDILFWDIINLTKMLKVAKRCHNLPKVVTSC